MSDEFAIGDQVRWKWGQGYGEGKIFGRFTEKVTRTISGTEVNRDAAEDEPVYLFEQTDGSQVLGSHAEIEKAD